MRKRNNGYILLALLVITGLGSQVYNATISSKERTLLHTELKSTKKEFLASVKELSGQQLAFKPNKESWSVAECIQHLALSEEKLWLMAEEALRQPASPEKRAGLRQSDEEIIRKAKDRSKKGQAPEMLQPSLANRWKTSEAALNSFKENRTKLLKYVKTTTHDMRSHVADQLGMDSYQVLLLIAAHTNRHTQQIEEIKKDPGYPW